ncbi:hypothetical protein KUTeg_021430 [Tegillarca granosa]|uniref:Uncharacterized protein n=1 Tax=Tegillarca granosa TaxID=220873 RepID=A0ABQ9E654_TEGGR|nr:hypothetical protein KUTeg_021430 [Tegillarca granosa]
MKNKQAKIERKEDEEETCCMEVDNGTGVKQFPTSDEKKPLLDEFSESNKEWKPYEPGILANILLSFSVYTNGSKLFNTKQTAGTLTAINGIRFLSMNWVILGHTFSSGIQRTGKNT